MTNTSQSGLGHPIRKTQGYLLLSSCKALLAFCYHNLENMQN